MIKVQNRDKHNCVQYLKKQLKMLEQRITQDGDRIRLLEQDNAKLIKTLQEEANKFEHMRLNMKNEIETKETLNEYYHKQLEDTQREIKILKSKQTSHCAANGGENLRSSNSSNGRNSAPGKMNNNSGSSLFPKNNLNTTHSLIDTAVLVNVDDETLREQHQQLRARSSNSKLETSKFYSSNSNINGTVRSNEGREQQVPSVVRSAMNLFNKLPQIPIPRLAPQPPPKPPRPSLAAELSNRNSNGSSHSDSIVPSTSTGSSINFFGIPTSNSTPSEPMDLIRELCQKEKIYQVLSLVNRRHFYPTNEYYKPVSTKRGAHSFALTYEIRLLEILGKCYNYSSHRCTICEIVQ